MKLFALPAATALLITGLLTTGCQHKPATDDYAPPAPAPQAGSTTALGAPVNGAAGMSSAGAGSVKNGVHTTASGVEYVILKSGPASGRSPTRSDHVTVHYHGTLLNGTVFDSSVQRGVPASFGVSQVIPGWTEVLQLMKPGDKWKVTIPSNMAYGAQGSPPSIPPFSILVFEIDLISIQ